MNYKKYLFILVLSLFLYAMGGNQDVVTKIPVPDRIFKVKIIDVENNEIIAENFSVDGLTYLPAKVGKTDVSIDFKKIESVIFLVKGDIINIKVKFNTGEESSFNIDKDIIFFGKTKWGNLKIKSQYIKKIIFIN